ncbi:MAG: glycosyltransferase family 4 protein [Candidatus Bathyarchaeota archaeon]|nr:MAG: glycosyltransferase family 4 protein [Candidatus Bathyarchaeota archaeon]
MRILILSWEFPPRIIGDLAQYVDRLAVSLVKKDVDVYIVTFHNDWTGFENRSDGVKIYRVSNQVKSHVSILTWDLTLVPEFIRAASDIYYWVQGEVDLIDAHEWLCIDAATSLRKAFNLPFIYTIHSLEDHRSFYRNDPLNISIKHLEKLGSIESDRVLVSSNWMKLEVRRLHGIPKDKIAVSSMMTTGWTSDVIKNYKMTIEAFKNLGNKN